MWEWMAGKRTGEGRVEEQCVGESGKVQLQPTGTFISERWTKSPHKSTNSCSRTTVRTARCLSSRTAVVCTSTVNTASTTSVGVVSTPSSTTSTSLVIRNLICFQNLLLKVFIIVNILVNLSVALSLSDFFCQAISWLSNFLLTQLLFNAIYLFNYLLSSNPPYL